MPNTPQQNNEITEIVSDANQTGVTTPKIKIDGVEYDGTNLSAAAKGAIASLQFAEARLMGLQNELAICQTARFAFIKGLKSEVEGKKS